MEFPQVAVVVGRRRDIEAAMFGTMSPLRVESPHSCLWRDIANNARERIYSLAVPLAARKRVRLSTAEPRPEREPIGVCWRTSLSSMSPLCLRLMNDLNILRFPKYIIRRRRAAYTAARGTTGEAFWPTTRLEIALKQRLSSGSINPAEQPRNDPNSANS